jgi:DMSO reductase anchor subunit
MLSGEKQKSWQLPAFLNLTLGGMGAGAYLAGLLLTSTQSGEWAQSPIQAVLLKLLGPALVSLGLLALTTEAGRPLNSIYLLTNVRHSWMSREALAGGVFILAAVLDWLAPHPVLRGSSALAALFFIVAQGMMVYRASGVVTWNVPAVPLFFLTCGLATGSGAMLLISGFLGAPSLAPLQLASVFAAAANGLAWLAYQNTPGETFHRALAPLNNAGHMALALGVGHLLPIALLLATLVQPLPLALPAAGLALMAGGAMQKYAFAFEASALRGLVRSQSAAK